MKKDLERVRGKLSEKHVLLESFRKAAKANTRGGEGQGRMSIRVTMQLRYAVCLQEGFYGFERFV